MIKSKFVFFSLLGRWTCLTIWETMDASLLFINITVLSLQHLLNLFFFLIYKVNNLLEACWADGPSTWPRRFDRLKLTFLIFGAESAVLCKDSTAEYGKSQYASNAANEEQAPKAVKGQLVLVHLIDLTWALAVCQPFVMDFLEIPIFRELEDSSWHINCKRGVPLESLKPWMTFRITFRKWIIRVASP